MFMYGLKCPLCSQPITAGQPVFTTWGMWLPPGDPLEVYCDGGMHWTCYAEWPERQRFAQSYFEFWMSAEENDPFWHRAHIDDEVLVTVNPSEPVRSAWVHLKSTGSRISVKLDEWEKWLASRTQQDHPLLDEVVIAAKRALRARVPDVDELLDGIDLPRKQRVVEAYRAAERERRDKQREVQRHTNQYNAECNRLMRRIERDGLTCPHCHKHSKMFRLAKRTRHRSAVICQECGWAVDPHLGERHHPN